MLFHDHCAGSLDSFNTIDLNEGSAPSCLKFGLKLNQQTLGGLIFTSEKQIHMSKLLNNLADGRLLS